MNPKTAIKIMLLLLMAVMIFHLCILLKIIPYEITWGGRLKSDSEMYRFESVSIAINLLLIGIILIKGKFIKAILPLKVVNSILWFFVALFGLNTIGNLLAETTLEKFFSIFTLLSSFLIWTILTKSKS